MEFLEIHLPHPWMCFLGFFFIFLICNIIMSRQSRHFKYKRATAIIPFSIIDLEFPGTEASIAHIIQGINALKNETGIKSRASLRANLLLDFVFMTGIYPSIFLLCMHAAFKMETIGRQLLIILAWLQLLAFLFDILENIYLLGKLKHPVISRTWAHRAYKRMVSAKWVIAVTGTICSLSCFLYFWLNNLYSPLFFKIGFGMLLLIVAGLALTVYKTFNAIFKNEAEEAKPIAT